MRGRLLHLGYSESVRTHATPSYKLVVGLDAPVRFRSGDRTGSAAAIVVPPGVPHSIQTDGCAVGLFLAAGGPLAPFTRTAGAISVPERATQARLRGLVRERAEHRHCDDAALVDDTFACLRLDGSRRVDVRVGAVLALIARQPDLSLATLARHVRLSPERMRHLVAEQTGMPLRALRLFQRTLLGLEHVARGRPLSAAALAAGFADHAHFTRSFVRTFGRTPSSVPQTAMRLLSTWAERDA